MLRKRIKKNTLKWKKIYAEQLLDMMDEEENALQKIYLTGYVLELKKNRYFAGWYKDRIVCRSLEYARYFPSAEAAEEYVHNGICRHDLLYLPCKLDAGFLRE